MERFEALERQLKVLKYLSNLPRRMASLHGTDNVTEFVLHDLCHEQCLNLTKAAFFVDNPDFNCTRGIAGFSRQEQCCGNCDGIWQDTKKFTDHRKSSAFNQQVRTLSHPSLKHSGDKQVELAGNLAHDLGFKNYGLCAWPMRHDNEGFMLYEKADEHDAALDEHIVNGVSLLSFCPLF